MSVCVPSACDDKCSGPLLDGLDLLDQHFLSLNLSAVTAAFYRRLLLLEARSRELQVPGHCTLVLRRVNCTLLVRQGRCLLLLRSLSTR